MCTESVLSARPMCALSQCLASDKMGIHIIFFLYHLENVIMLQVLIRSAHIILEKRVTETLCRNPIISQI